MEIFYIKLILSFIVGGSFVIAATVLAEKYGTKVGGIIAGFPSTVLFGLLFIAWTQSEQIAVEATAVVPLMLVFNNFFVLIYIFVSRFNFWLALFGSILFWFVYSTAIYFMPYDNYLISCLLYIIALIIAYYILEKNLKVKSSASKKIEYSFGKIIFRGALSGSIVALSVILTKISGPVLGGIFAVFPALFISTILITYFAHGVEYTQSMMKIAVLSLISALVYVTIVRFSYIPLGMWWGTLLGIVIAAFISYIVYNFWVRKLN